MTTRRTILQGAAALIAPAPWPKLQTQIADMGEGKFAGFLSEWRRLDEDFVRSMGRLTRAEQDAQARGVRWGDCPKVAAIFEEEGLCLHAMNDVVQRAAQTTAANLNDIVLKFVLWRLSDAEADGFANPCDMLSFAVYRDLLALTGREALAHPADEKAFATLWNDSAFYIE